MAEWLSLNAHAKALELPPPLQPARDSAHAAVCRAVEARVGRGREWVLRSSHYTHGKAAHPHFRIKREVNAWLARTSAEVLGGDLATRLRQDPSEIVLLLEAPSFGTTTALAARCGEALLRSPQVVCPQADLAQYVQMVGDGDISVGVRAQRLDHWLCANKARGLRVVVAFFDFETRALGSRNEALCPMADVMRFFRYGYAAADCVFCVTVGLWPGELSSTAAVDAAVQCEARAAGFEVRLVRKWEYRMVALLYVLRRRTAAFTPTAVAAAPRVAGARAVAAAASYRGGPVVITSDGSLRGVANWEGLSSADREWTERRVAERNAARLRQMLGEQQALRDEFAPAEHQAPSATEHACAHAGHGRRPQSENNI